MLYQVSQDLNAEEDALARQMKQDGAQLKRKSEPVDLFLGSELYYKCLVDLLNSHSISMAGSLHPIPWETLVKYCEYYDIDKDESRDFIYIVSHADSQYVLKLNERNAT